MKGQALKPIHYVRAGPRGAEPVIFTRPVGLDLTFRDRQIEALHKHHGLVAYDLPGHGDKPGTVHDWTFEQAADDLADLLRSMEARRAHIVWYLTGGMIAQHFAPAYPDLVRSLALIGTASAFPDEARHAMRERAVTARRDGMTGVLQASTERWFTPQTVATRPDILDRVRRTLLARHPAMHAAIWEMISRLDITNRLGEITCPALMLMGELDPSCPPTAVGVLHNRIAGSNITRATRDLSHVHPRAAGVRQRAPFELSRRAYPQVTSNRVAPRLQEASHDARRDGPSRKPEPP